MNFQRFLAKRLTQVALGIPRAFAALWKRLGRWRRTQVPARGGRRGPDDGTQSAGVVARLRPTPPVLSASAGEPLPDYGETGAA